MPIHHKARTGKTYYLHVKRKDEMVNYFFSMDPNGQLADAVPEGYEIYENIGGQVFLRRKAPQVISEAELALVVEALKSPSKGQFYKTEVKKNAIVVYEAADRTEFYRALGMPSLSEDKLREVSMRSLTYQAVMRFVLVDRDKRLFSAERYCFRGSVDDWIAISPDGATLPAHLKKFTRHLGKESFFDLF